MSPPRAAWVYGLVLPLMYLVVELSFCSQLIHTLGDDSQQDILSGLELSGRLISGVGLGLLLHRLVSARLPWPQPSAPRASLRVAVAAALPCAAAAAMAGTLHPLLPWLPLPQQLLPRTPWRTMLLPLAFPWSNQALVCCWAAVAVAVAAAAAAEHQQQQQLVALPCWVVGVGPS